MFHLIWCKEVNSRKDAACNGQRPESVRAAVPMAASGGAAAAGVSPVRVLLNTSEARRNLIV